MENQKVNLRTEKQDRARTGLQRCHEVVKRKEEKIAAWVEIDADLCKECGLCVEACPVGVLKISTNLNKMGYHPVEYTGEGCTGCGICFYVCPEPGTFIVHKPVKAKALT